MKKIFVHGFWGGFVENTDPTKFHFFQDLLEQVFGDKIELGSFEDSSLLLESVFSDNTFLDKKKWEYTFFFNGESQSRIIQDHFKKNLFRLSKIANYNCILTGKFTNPQIKTVNLPLFIPYLYSNPHFIPLLENPTPRETVPSKAICAVISNSNCPLRNSFLDKLSRVFRIDYAGNFRNNVPKIPGAYNSPEIINFYSQYKFVICLENTKQETYITEKIINGFLSKSIPIYWGSNVIYEYFNPERFINVPNLSNEAVHQAIQQIKSVIHDDHKYLKMVNQPIFNTKKDFHPNLNVIAKDIQLCLGLER